MADDRDFPYDWSNPQDKQSNLQEYGCKAVICACKRDSEDPKKCALSFVISDTPPQSPDLEREAREWHDADYWMREYEILRRVMNMRDAVFEIVQMARIEYEKNMDL